MATDFPTGLDALTNPTATDYLNSPSHAGQHANANDAIEALQAKVGINSSAVTSSLDYKITSILASIADLITKVFTFKGAWVTSTYYKVNDCVQQGGSGYVCMTAHTSGTFATDLAAGKWALFVQGGEAPNETITILPMSSYSNTNWGTVELSTATPGNMRNMSDGTQNAEIAFNVALSAGTWKLLLGSTVDGNRGIYSVRIDDNEVGTIDGYAAAPGVGFTGVTGITIASTGVKKLSLKMATKNALSSGYYGVFGVILLIKTA